MQPFLAAAAPWRDTQTDTLLDHANRMLDVLTSPYGVFASNDGRYRNAVFGRDSLEVAEDLILTHPEITRRVLISLAELQGTRTGHLSQEEPGRIHHEHRSLYFGGKRVDADSELILKQLAAGWGGTDTSLTYYGTVDATPLYIRLVHRYCAVHGPGFLHEEITDNQGRPSTIAASVRGAATWLLARLGSSQTGLLEYYQGTQTWKDSEEFFVHTDGSHASRPVAAIEAQGLTYDALVAAAELLPDMESGLSQQAERLQQLVLNDMWMPKQQYFATAMDIGPDGRPRRLTQLSASPAELLDSGIFDALPSNQKRLYIAGIVRQVFSPDFLTAAGVRSRALSHRQLIPFWDYHGSFVSWPKETYDIAKGLRRQRLPRLAMQLENRLVHTARLSGQFLEFIYVDERGTPLLHAANQPPARIVPGRNLPTSVQAWTVSAVIGSLTARPGYKAQEWWQAELESSMLAAAPDIGTALSAAAQQSFYPSATYSVAAQESLADWAAGTLAHNAKS